MNKSYHHALEICSCRSAISEPYTYSALRKMISLQFLFLLFVFCFCVDLLGLVPVAFTKVIGVYELALVADFQINRHSVSHFFMRPSDSRL